MNCGGVEHMKEIGNSQPPTAEPSKKKKRRRTSTHYTDKKRKTVRTQKPQARKAPIEGCGTPDDLSQSIKDLRKPSWRLDSEIQPFHLSPIVEEADGSKTHTMAKVEELGNDNIQEDSREETNSTSVVRILRVLPREVHSLLYIAYTCVRDLFIGGVIYLAKKSIR